MSILNKLFGGKGGLTPREIVYEFADTLAQCTDEIADAKRLKRSKDEIRKAFEVYIAGLRQLAKYSSDARSELEQVQSVYLHIADFQHIDPEDQHLVDEINFGERFAWLRLAREQFLATGDSARSDEVFEHHRDDSMLAGKLQAKYFQRIAKESGI